MKSDLPGRIRNTKLPLSHGLLPVYEALVNAIDGIEERNDSDGRIVVTLLRDDTQMELEAHGNTIADLTGFVIQDNGVGFTQGNFESFETLDSRAKVRTGGKGIGRLLWLKAFEEARISSTFEDTSGWHRRSFTFRESEDGVEEHELEALSPPVLRETTVELVGFKGPYQAATRKSIRAVAQRMIEHTLEYFVLGRAPHVLVEDSWTGERIDLQELYQNEYRPESEERMFAVGEEQFRILDVLLATDATGSGHKLHFCAHSRVVTAQALTDAHVPHLGKTVTLPGGEERIYQAYVRGDYLNDRVDQERTGFLIDADGELEFAGGVKWGEITKAAVEAASEFLSPLTRDARERSWDRIEKFVKEEAPQYRPLLKHRRAALESVRAEQADGRLELALHRIMTDLKHDLRVQAHDQLTREEEPAANLGELSEQRREILEKLQDMLKADLVEYVVQRRTVLEFFRSLLGKRGASFAPEESLHEIFFPLKTSSNDVDYNDHNLWILDERLAYHQYLASDLPLKSHDGPVITEAEDRPDLLIYNRSMVFSEEALPSSSAVVIEFKRPERNDYDDKKSPIGQVLRYVNRIREGRASRDDGSTITVPGNLPFYCYVIATLTPRLRADAIERGFTVSPDGQGFFAYNPNYKAYIEIMSFHKVLDDAIRRNRIFFDKLGIPLH